MLSLDEMMGRWQGIQGGNMVCCGTREEDWHLVMDIASQYDNVLPGIGLHPWFVNSATRSWVDTLDSYLDQYSNVVAVGEIGIDLLIKGANPTLQEEILITQMAMARERKLPVSLHVRKGWDIFIRILKHMGSLPEGGVIHSYSGSADMVKLFEQYGLYISFSGSVTNSHNKKVRRALGAVSPGRLLIETDSPALLPVFPERVSSPAGFRELDGNLPQNGVSNDSFVPEQWPAQLSPLYSQGWNEPANIFMVALAVSDILQMELRDIIRLTRDNGQSLFRG